MTAKIYFTRRRKFGYYQKGVYPPEFNFTFKTRIRKRDKYRCAICKEKKRLDIHHIDYTKYTVPANCISLCRDCHNMLHDRGLAFYKKLEWKSKLHKLAVERELELQCT